MSLPLLTNRGDQTKIQVVLHVESPTNPYRILCSRCESLWWFWLGAGALTIAYHLIDLARHHPSGSFTNHYHRGEGLGGQGIDVSV